MCHHRFAHYYLHVVCRGHSEVHLEWEASTYKYELIFLTTIANDSAKTLNFYRQCTGSYCHIGLRQGYLNSSMLAYWCTSMTAIRSGKWRTMTNGIRAVIIQPCIPSLPSVLVKWKMESFRIRWGRTMVLVITLIVSSNTPYNFSPTNSF